MKIEVLGSGGAVTTPKMFCTCESCVQARSGGARFSRLGPSVFIHGPDILIDTPEEISVELNRSLVTRIEACFYSHWHPDHTSGKRIFEMNKDWNGFPPQNRVTHIVLTEKIKETFNSCMALMEHFRFLENERLVRISVIGNSETVEMGGFRITPVQLAADYVFGYTVSDGQKNALIIMDELKGWLPDETIRSTRFDAVYLPFGILDINPVYNKRNIASDHPMLETEATITDTLKIIGELDSDLFVLSHIEEPDNITVDLARHLEYIYSNQMGKTIRLAHDGMVIDLG